MSGNRNILDQGDRLLQDRLDFDFAQNFGALTRQIIIAEFPGFQMSFRNDLHRGLPGPYANPVKLHVIALRLLRKFIGKLRE